MSAITTSKKRPFAFREAVIQESKIGLGENGCPQYTDTGSNVLDLSLRVRGDDPGIFCDKIWDSSQNNNVRDVADAIALVFLTRNVRGGKGEKTLSFQMFLNLCRHFPVTALQLLPLFVHFGYWKDLLLLVDQSRKLGIHDLKDRLLQEALRLMRDQFHKDLAIVDAYEKEQDSATSNNNNNNNNNNNKNDTGGGPKISLLAKWLPRENSHFDKRLKFLREFLQLDGMTDAQRFRACKAYRQGVSKLTAYLDLPEVYLSAQRADEIIFSKIASKATFKLSRALLNETKDGGTRHPNDPKRIKCANMFVQHLLHEGCKGQTLMPDEIVAEILKGKVSPMRARVLDAQWKDLWKGVVEQARQRAQEDGLDFDPSKMVPLSDVSGSMYGKPMEVAIALGIGISEICHPAFRNMVLTFQSNPTWHMLKEGDSIVQKVQSLVRAPWGGSTNFEKAFELILTVCIKHRLAKEDVPSLIVFSDMQFDIADYARTYTVPGCPRRGGSAAVLPMHEVLRKRFAEVAQQLQWSDAEPTPIVYWNLRNTAGHPVNKDTEGTVLLSGFSPNMLKMVMNGEALQDQEVEVVQADGTVTTQKVRVTPNQVLRKALDESLYDPVREILLASNEGILAEYRTGQADASVTADDDFVLC